MFHSGIKVFAPASVSNVAVGYDLLGFPIQGMGDELVVKTGQEKGLKITKIFGNKSLSKDPNRNCASISALALLKHLGQEDLPIELELYKKMPLGTGLGSSASSAVAGVFAINEYLRRPLEKKDLLPFAMEAERFADGAYHADNVAPSLLGGITLNRDNETLDVNKVHVPKGLYITIILPAISILTKDSRDILKPEVSMSDFVKQTGNLASLILGLQKSDFDLIKRSLQDHVIEPQRAHLIPHFYDHKEMALSEGALGFSISGAGPSMFAISGNSLIAENIREKAASLYQKHKLDARCFVTTIDLEGARRF